MIHAFHLQEMEKQLDEETQRLRKEVEEQRKVKEAEIQKQVAR